MSEHDTSAEVAKAVAANLRALRARRGWSLETLAQRSGVSKGALVALEGERGNPSLTTLCRITDAFAVSLSDLIDTGRPTALRRVTIAEATVLWRGPSGGIGRLILSTDPPNPVELWTWRLEPGERKDSEAHAAGTQEVYLVSSGVLTVHTDGQTVTTQPGIAVTFPGTTPHSYYNEGTEPVEFLQFTTVPQ